MHTIHGMNGGMSFIGIYCGIESLLANSFPTGAWLPVSVSYPLHRPITLTNIAFTFRYVGRLRQKAEPGLGLPSPSALKEKILGRGKGSELENI